MNTTDNFELENLTHTKYLFTPNECEKILRYGAWASDLDSGREMPTTERQSHFVSVGRGEIAPQTDFEFLWLKYKETIRVDREISRLIGDAKYNQAEKSRLIESSTRNQHDTDAIRRSAITDSEKAKSEIEFLNSRITKLQAALSACERRVNPTVPEVPTDKYASTVEVWREQT